MERSGRLALVAVLFVLVLVSTASSQSLQVGNIEGTVIDNSGAVVPGATVTITSPVLITPRTTVTDTAGVYRFPALPLGTYAMTFELSGFKKVVREGLEVTAARTLTIDTTLEAGELTETLTVVGEVPMVDVTNTNVATSIDADTLQEVPSARDVWAILQTLAPQVVLDREDVGGSQGGLQAVFSAFGSTWHQNTYALNGVNVTDPSASGAAGFYYDYDSFQETQVSTAQHSAEIGTPGVYYNIVVKSGTDKFHGGSAYYFENDSMVSDNLTQELKDQGVSRGGGIDLFSDWTAQLGGPLVKDKVRFFTSWRDWRIHRFVVDFPKTENTDMFSGLGNVTWQINPNNRITGLYTAQTYWKPNRNAAANIPPESTWIEDDVFSIYQGVYNSQLNDKALLDARVSYSTVSFPLYLQEGVNRQNVTDLGTGYQTGVATFGYDPAQWRTRLAIDGSLSYFARTGNVDHSLKAGYEYFRGYADYTLDALDAVNLTTVNGVPDSVTQYTTPVKPVEEFYGSVLYAQDAMSFGKVTLNLGLRFENTTGALPDQTSPAGPYTGPRAFGRQEVYTWNTWAPRIGVVYDPLPSHTLAVKAGWSRYYHASSTGFPGTVNKNGLAGTAYSWNDNGDRQFQRGEEGALLYSFGGNINTVDPDLKQPYTDEFALGFEFEGPAKISFKALYLHREGNDLLALVERGIPFDTGYTAVTAIDPGPDNNGRTPVTVYNLRPEFIGKNAVVMTNPSDFNTSFDGLQLQAQRRFADGWQILGSYAYSSSDISRTNINVSAYGGEEEGAGGIGFGNGSSFLNPNQKINNTDGPGFYDRTHSFKLAGSYEFPGFPLTLAATAKVQTGTPYGRILTVTQDANGVPFNQGAITFFAEGRDSYRFPTLKAMDLRVAYGIPFGGQHKVDLIADFFNLFNVSTVTIVNANTGSGFGQPQDIYGPRVFRIGARWTF